MFRPDYLYLYGFGNEKEIKSGNLSLRIFHSSNQARVPTPEIFKE